MNAASKVFRNRVLYNIPERLFPKFLAGSSKVVLTLKVTGIVLAQTALSVVAIGLTAADLWYSICKNEKGIIIFAKGLALLGSTAGLASIFIGGATFLLLNPLGWVALLLTLAAFALIWFFSKTPLEAWLQYGPFSASPEPYLTNETEAFYRLVGIYTDIQITIENNPAISRTDPKNRQEIEIPYESQGIPKAIKFTRINAGTRIRITSQLNGLMASGKETLVYNSHFRLKPQGGSFLEEVNSKVHNYLTIIENDLPNGKEYIIDSIDHVKDYRTRGNIFLRSYDCTWQVESQILSNYGGKTLAFPALRANDDEQYNYTQAVQAPYNTANFNRDSIGETHRPFWANETSHLAKPSQPAASPQVTGTSTRLLLTPIS